jgi:hypothetical protein
MIAGSEHGDKEFAFNSLSSHSRHAEVMKNIPDDQAPSQ